MAVEFGESLVGQANPNEGGGGVWFQDGGVIKQSGCHDVFTSFILRSTASFGRKMKKEKLLLFINVKNQMTQ